MRRGLRKFVLIMAMTIMQLLILITKNQDARHQRKVASVHIALVVVTIARLVPL
jgi:hypothetical protein